MLGRSRELANCEIIQCELESGDVSVLTLMVAALSEHKS
jgi:hypothetical protein